MQLQKIIVATVLAVAACGGKTKGQSTGPTAGSAETKSLYDRLGGKDAITAVVDDFIANVAADARINAMFANADIPALKTKLVDQICEATGGPCTYTGKSMKESHTGMGVTDAHFDALVEDLKKSLDKFQVGATEQEQLLGALGGMRPDIVTK